MRRGDILERGHHADLLSQHILYGGNGGAAVGQLNPQHFGRDQGHRDIDQDLSLKRAPDFLHRGFLGVEGDGENSDLARLGRFGISHAARGEAVDPCAHRPAGQLNIDGGGGFLCALSRARSDDHGISGVGPAQRQPPSFTARSPQHGDCR